MFKIKLLAVFIIALSVAPALSQDKPEQPVKKEVVQDLYNLGLSALEKKQYEKARDLLLKAISYDDNFIEAHAKLGDAYQLLKEEELGYESYKKCLQIINKTENPSEDMLKLSEDIQQKIKKFKALDDKISAITEEFIIKFMATGNQSLGTSDYLLADEIFSLVLRMALDNTEAAEGLQKARAEFAQEANSGQVAEEKDLANTHFQDGLELFKKSKYSEASEKFRKAMSYRADFIDAIFNLGECYSKLNDNNRALKNYRRSLKLLQQEPNRSKEHNDLLARVSRAMDKIDTIGKSFQKSKTEYISKLNTLVSEWMYKRYQRFAYYAIQRILIADPVNKPASEALEKIDEKITQAQKNDAQSNKLTLIAKSPPRKIFNGTDLNDWLFGGCPKENWNIAGGKIKGGPSATNADDVSAFLIWTGPAPQNSILTMRFSAGNVINKKLGGAEIGGVYSYDKEADYFWWGFVRYHVLAKDMNTLELITRDNQYSVFLNNDLIHQEKRGKGEPKAGVYIKNVKVVINSITLQETE
ncbi:MAG: hypothetical protein HZA49_07615 [Planctomycetes bacterium]|nr:hypothetical protein [Planctomycetota bacterium]